ncbi:unnamed protein product [Schistocephalus solidus]|uniref:ZnF_CDGSH domain-containing protein n=1 Tax=Schistocephalus solidus TaxID=70667 RepID=A0A183TEI2_SCHSO|nr:unnamed protein product [Schistocephalus solidus]
MAALMITTMSPFVIIFYRSVKELIELSAFTAFSAAIAYSVCYTQAKCVDIVDIESIDQKKVFCRCWLSSKFPYCDGSHNKHNEETGDNVGPLIIEPKKTL